MHVMSEPQIVDGVAWAPGLVVGGNYIWFVPHKQRYLQVDGVILSIQPETETCTITVLEAEWIEPDELPVDMQSVYDRRRLSRC